MSAVRSALRVLALSGVALFLAAGPSRAAQQFQGLCSRVKIEINQELALERVGFLATLTVTNNEGDASITDFSAALTFASRDADGQPVDAANLFFVQPPELKGIAAVDGTGIIPPGQTAEVRWFIVPKTSAGGVDPAGVAYDVGANLAGSIYGQEIPPEVFLVIPDTITVKPDPELEITYFQPRDVDGDDPFTPEVETPIPFTLGVLVKNSGHGRAKSVRIASEQPKIVENKQGLLLIAQLLGARVDDQPRNDASLKVDLGDIEPARCRKGAWDMITSLSGEFTEFKASYTHASELGGRDTSLIKSLNAYFMVHEVLNDQPGRDGLKDFLAETLGGEQLIPDTLFESDCNTLPVNSLSRVAVGPIQGYTTRVQATADVENWVFLRVDDPAQARYKIRSVVRSDGKVLNPANYWTNIRYRKTDNAKLTYLNLFDFVALGDYEYTVTYEPPTIDVTPPVTTLRYSGPSAQQDGKAYVLPETQLYFTAEDASPVSTWYRLDGAGQANGDPLPAYPFQITTTGEHAVEYFSRDAAGNEEAHRTETVVVSVDYPAVANLAADTNALVYPGQSVSVRPTALTVGFDGVGVAAGLTGLAEVFRGVFAWPSVAGVPPAPTAATAATLSADGENLDYVRYRLGIGAWSAEQPATTPLQLSGLSGTVQLSVSGRSRYGSYRPDSEATVVSWLVGSDGPVGATGAPAIPTRSGDATLGVTGSADYCYRVDGTYFQPNLTPGAPITLLRLADGEHRVDLLARGSGQACPADGTGTTVRWTVDRDFGLRLPPSERVRSLDLGAVTGAASFTWDGRDDSGAVVPPDWYTVKVTVTDPLGRHTSAVRLVQVGDMLTGGGLLAGSLGGQSQADAAGRWAVWQDQTSGSWDIFARDLQDPAGAAIAIAATARNEERPRTDGRLVVWEDRQADGSWDVWAKELGTAAPPFAVTATPDADERRPAVDWPWVVYQAKSIADPAAPWQVFAKNLVTGTTVAADPTTQNELDPAVSGDRVVWQDFRDAGYGEIYLKDLAPGSVRRITNDPGGQYHPDISGDWVVWADNRNTQFDLYGLNLNRGRAVRLTNTPENEISPRVVGPWVVYLEDAAGVAKNNIRVVSLSNLASVQLTNDGTPKETPKIASGRLVWVDGRLGRNQVMTATVPDLQPVFGNANAVAVTAGAAANQPDAYALLRRWNAEAGVTALTRYTQLVPEPVSETVTWSGGAPTGANFPLEPGTFLWARFGSSRILDLGPSQCDALNLATGTNVLAYPCFPDGYTAYRLVRDLGEANVAAVRALDAERGNWLAAAVTGGQIAGEDFAIPRVGVVLIELTVPVGPWRPAER